MQAGDGCRGGRRTQTAGIEANQMRLCARLIPHPPGRDALEEESSGRLKFLKPESASTGARWAPPAPLATLLPLTCEELLPELYGAGGPIPPAPPETCTLDAGLRSCSFLRMKRRCPKLAIPSLRHTSRLRIAVDWGSLGTAGPEKLIVTHVCKDLAVHVIFDEDLLVLVHFCAKLHSARLKKI